MTERTDRNADASLKKLRKIYIKLKGMPKDIHPSGDELHFARNSISSFLKALDTPSTTLHELSILGISEAFRIAPQALSPLESHRIFESLLRVVPLRSVPLSSLVQSGLPSQLQDSTLILQFITAYPSLPYNRHSMADIIAAFIDSSSDKQRLINSVFSTKDILLIRKVSTTAGTKLLDDSNYLFYYMNWLGTDAYSGHKVPFRHITLEGLMNSCKLSKLLCLTKISEYIRRSIMLATRDVFVAYAQNENARLRLETIPAVTNNTSVNKTAIVLKELICSDEAVRSLYTLLLDDPEECVRQRAASLADWDLLSNILTDKPEIEELHQVFLERVLDRSGKVRETAYKVIEDGIVRNKECHLFSDEQNSSQNSLALLRESLLFLCKGCLTEAKPECQSLLKKHCPSLEFLYETRKLPGVVEFIKTIEIDDSMYISMQNKPCEFINFFLFNCTTGTMDASKVEELLQKGCCQAIKHITGPEAHLNSLFLLLKHSEELEVVERAAKLIADFMRENCIYHEQENLLDNTNKIVQPESIAAGEHINMGDKAALSTADLISKLSEPEKMAEWPAYLFFIASHLPNEYDCQLDPRVFEMHTYPVLYFLSRKAPNDPRFINSLTQASISDDQRAALILSAGCLEKYVDLLLRMNPTITALESLISTKTLAAAQMYFLFTGRVQIQSPGFFLSCIKLLAQASPHKKIALILKRYMSALPSETYDVFYTLATNLRAYRLSGPEGSGTDSLLESILERVVTIRPGKLVNFPYDLESAGFVPKS